MIERKIVSQGYKSSITGGKEMAGSLQQNVLHVEVWVRLNKDLFQFYVFCHKALAYLSLSSQIATQLTPSYPSMQPPPRKQREPQAQMNANPQGENSGALEFLPSSSRSNSNSEVGYSSRTSSWNHITFLISMFVSCSAAEDRPESLGWTPGAGCEVSFIREAL